MEVDGIPVARLIAKSTAAYFDHLDPAVDALGCAIVSLQDDGVNNAPEMFLDGSGNLPDRFQSAAKGPG